MKKRSFAVAALVTAVIMLFTCTSAFAIDSDTANMCSVSGTVNGLSTEDSANAIVILYDETNAYQSSVSENGRYEFSNVPAGTYYIKVEIVGYHIPEPSVFELSSGSIANKDITVTKATSDSFFYSWAADESYFGYEESANVPSQKEVLFSSEKLYISDTGAEKKLYDTFAVILSDEGEKWSNEYASRLLDLLSSIYSSNRTHASKWVLTFAHLTDDITIQYETNGDIVTISMDAFANAIPRTASLNGLSGSYYSNRLYNALIRYATHQGEDTDFVNNLLAREYGCSIYVSDYVELTRDTTVETAESFEQFHPEELLSILDMFAEMPEGFHKVKGLKYLVRRADGYPHPLYANAAAVAWPTLENGYIEFVDKAFLASQVEDTYRLILHEKAHFLWQNVFSDELRDSWCEVGGWYENPSDPDGWSTTKETEFVTAYAHSHNPDEDMAESIAYYILLPDKLESRSPVKYEFIRNYIMNGEIYLSQIREDLTFEVYNLYPDYNYPGRIVGLDILVSGQPDQDKTVIITLTLDTHGDASFGASSALMRITSEVGTFTDLWLVPTNRDCSVLTGTLTINKYSASGYWTTDQIILTDQSHNQRFAGSGADKFGWKLYITNSLADYENPEYVQGTLKVALEPGKLDDHDMTYVDVTFKATDDVGVGFVYCEMANQTYNCDRIGRAGTYDASTETATIRVPFTEYMQSGTYAITFIKLGDIAGNFKDFTFYPNSGSTPYTTFEFQSDNSDYEPPELDVNRIYVSAYPTHPENPNGETVVNIKYYVKDNLSGLDRVSYQFLDPLGNTHYQYHYHENFYTIYFVGDQTVWKEYNISVLLPEGSAPGKWGLLELMLSDKAGNIKAYKFLETVHFSVGDASGLYDINAVAGDGTVSISTNMYYNGDKEIYGLAAVYNSDGRMLGLSGYANFSKGLQSFFFPDIAIDCDIDEICYVKVFIIDRETLAPIFYREKYCSFE